MSPFVCILTCKSVVVNPENEKNVFFSKTYLNTECMYADNIIVDDD